MKNLTFLVLAIGFGFNVSFAQENDRNPESGKTMYTMFANMVPDQFNFPLIGLVNLAWGSHNSAHIGAVNWNQKNLNGVQIGFVNANGEDFKGVQAGFINANSQSLAGWQFGVVNIVAEEKMTGSQAGIINATKQLKGLQIGVINYIDELEGGVPLGVLSFVKNGGYKAVEYSATEINPVNISLKLGIEKLYTTFYFGYNPLSDEALWGIKTGIGLGSIIRFNESFFFNPELANRNSTYGRDNIFQLSFTPSVGYKLLSHLSVVAGPSVTWTHGEKTSDPFFHIAEKEIDKENRIYAGAKLGMRYEW
jgi:hypothetical protein